MKRFFMLACMITMLGCSSTSNIKIVSPSTPEKEAKEEIRKAPITKLEATSQSPAGPEDAGRRDADAQGHKTDRIKIVSPSTPEKEAKEEIRKAPITKPEATPQSPARREATVRKDAVTETPVAEKPNAPEPDGASASIKSVHTLDALINLLEKKGIIREEELLDEIKRLEMKRPD